MNILKYSLRFSSARIRPRSNWVSVSVPRYFVASLILICSLSGCGSMAERDQAGFEKDKTAVTNVQRIQAGLAQTRTLPQSDLDLLKTIHAKYPAATEVRKVLQSALEARQDWTAIAQLLSEKPDNERTTQENILLAKVYIKLGRYQDASRIVGPMADAAPGNLELNSLAGHAWYSEGRYDEAQRAFDRVWDAIIAAKQVDEILMRGMIYFYKGDKDRAIGIIQKTIEMKPDFVSGNNALSRVYYAKGDRQQAELYRSKAEQAHLVQTANEARQMRLVSRSRDLENAYAARRYDECALIALEMIQTADKTQKPALYDYLGKAYEALGKQSEAQAAFAEAARLRQ